VVYVLKKGGELMGAETLNKTPEMGGAGGGNEGIRPTANYDDEPERDPDPTGILRRAHTERYGPSSADYFIGVSPDAVIRAARARRSADENSKFN
jgi:hypothetical protein